MPASTIHPRVVCVGFDNISLTDIPSQVFYSEPTDLPFSPNHCTVIRTGQGVRFKLSNALERASSNTANYQ